ncbi:hypothetical protein M426DRAFT_15667 [Hypoxylon sp. CI-4A]|nr:hypothetical protein M426DRAFT_15667 [Hypoxylon sp. CI-4A]
MEAPNTSHIHRPLPPPTIHVPASSSTVDVRIIDTGLRIYVEPELFWRPVLKGLEGPNVPAHCFLVSHGDRHVLFDLGLRSDWENYPPKIVTLIKSMTRFTNCEKDVASVLDEDDSGLDIRSSDIEAVVWSHTHFDHVGDPSRFPPSTKLVVGPGIKECFFTDAYPSNPDGLLLDSDAEGREVHEVRFDTGLRIGHFNAFDYFGDGSFYLLDAPGHALGHMCALARTTADPPTFIFMGGDACHHAGAIRPTRYLPLPQPSPSDHSRNYGGCPGDILARLSTWKSPDEPFFNVTNAPIFSDYLASEKTLARIEEFDAVGNALVIIAHDHSLVGHLPLFPQRVNDWQKRGIRESTRWLFCKDLEHATPE